MGSTTKLTFEEFQNLPEKEGVHYELDEGELLMEPSPAVRHNLIRQRIAMRMMIFAESQHLGIVLEEMDFRLAPDTVRNPDVAFVTSEHLKKIDLDRSPIDGAPALTAEVISCEQYRPGYRQENAAISRGRLTRSMDCAAVGAPCGSSLRQRHPSGARTGDAEGRVSASRLLLVPALRFRRGMTFIPMESAAR